MKVYLITIIIALYPLFLLGQSYEFSPTVDSIIRIKEQHELVTFSLKGYDLDEITSIDVGDKRTFKRILRKGQNVKFLSLFLNKVVLTNDINRLTKLEYFYINSEKLTVKKDFSAPESLKMFGVYLGKRDENRYLSDIPSFLYHQDSLVSLNLPIKSFSSIKSENIETFNDLELLILRLLRIDSLPLYIFKLEKLYELDIEVEQYNENLVLNNDLASLKNLKSVELPIDLSKNLTIISGLSSLEKLSVCECSSVNDLSEYKFKNLRVLNITNISETDLMKLRKMFPNVKINEK